MIEPDNLLEFIIDESEKGTRLDLVLSVRCHEFSRNFIQKLFEKGNIRVNGDVCTSKKYKCSSGDIISLEIPEPRNLEVMPENIPIEIIYEDSDVLLVNKPAGMVVHPAPGNYSGTLVNAILYHCGDNLSSINGVIRPGIVHRIDKDTSGLLMIAKTDYSHRELSSQLSAHSTTRRYTAIVHDNIRDDLGVIEGAIGRHPKNRMKNAVIKPGMPGYSSARHAVTHYRVLERFGRYTLIEAELETGRTHQIRVHMSSINHPLLGDELYGPVNNKKGATRQMLHAGLLGFVHPTNGEYMEFKCELPDDFIKVLKSLRDE